MVVEVELGDWDQWSQLLRTLLSEWTCAVAVGAEDRILKATDRWESARRTSSDEDTPFHAGTKKAAAERVLTTEPAGYTLRETPTFAQGGHRARRRSVGA